MHAQRTWLEIQCQSYADAGGQVVVLVLGYDSDLYLDALGRTLAEQPETLSYGGCSLYLLHNPTPEFGPFSSLQQACCWIESATDYQAAFFLPIDTPLPSASVLSELAAAMKSGIKIVQPHFGHRGGHPVLLSRCFLWEMTTMNPTLPESRLDCQIRQRQETGTVISVPVTDARVGLNLNDPAAWERYFETQEMFGMDKSSIATPGAG